MMMVVVVVVAAAAAAAVYVQTLVFGFSFTVSSHFIKAHVFA